MGEADDRLRRGPGHRSRYGPYRGGPDPLAPPVDLAEALDAIGEEVMAGYGPERAMREFLRRGGRDHVGLDELARRVAEKRRRLAQRHGLGGTLQEVRELLDRAVLAERGQLARDVEMDDADRAFREVRLDALPASPAAAVAELSTYGWASGEAREAFEQIRDLLGRELLDQRFAGMKQALEGASDADRAAVQQMLADLSRLLDKHARGVGTRADLERFLERHGDFFPERPRDVEELLDGLAGRAAAARRMLGSMTPEQREELLALSAQAFGSPELQQALAELDARLQAMRPGEDWAGSERMEGTEALGLGEGTGVFEEIAELDALAEQLGQSYGGARMAEVDLDALERQLGEQSAADARRLAELERALRDSGYLERGGDGTVRLTPRAMRQLGRSLLADAARRASGRRGARRLSRAGAAGEPTGGTREWTFGATEPWDVTRSITNAVLRSAGEPGGLRPDPATGRPAVRLDLRDVEVGQTEERTQACVALLVDTSFSMAMEGRWVPMKRTALALHTLVHTRFRGDALQLVGFGRHAQVMAIEELTALDAAWEKGTNLHHALLLANRHFRRHPRAQPVLLVVTDGEPTAHLERDGDVTFSYPPHPVTLAPSVRELDAARRLGAQTTFFRLGDDPGLARFVDRMARRVEGRVIAPEADDLGATVVGSYLGSRVPSARGAPGGGYDHLSDRRDAGHGGG